VFRSRRPTNTPYRLDFINRSSSYARAKDGVNLNPARSDQPHFILTHSSRFALAIVRKVLSPYSKLAQDHPHSDQSLEFWRVVKNWRVVGGRQGVAE
jgi:hypothetical protein